MFNINPIMSDTLNPRVLGMPYMSMFITINSEIQISERVVKDAVTLFGDIGGFQSFFLAF